MILPIRPVLKTVGGAAISLLRRRQGFQSRVGECPSKDNHESEDGVGFG